MTNKGCRNDTNVEMILMQITLPANKGTITNGDSFASRDGRGLELGKDKFKSKPGPFIY